MANSLIKNSRFATGTHVDILYNPVWEAYTADMGDTTANGVFQIICTFSITGNLNDEMFGVGDIAAFGFGVGVISQMNVNGFYVDFPNSMFPDDDVMRYVGNEIQHVYVFQVNGPRMNNLVVNKYTQVINTADYGYAKTNYNRQTDATLSLVPLKMPDDGQLSAVQYSVAHVLKSCDDEDYEITTNTWDANFPIELSGTSIDPIYRRAFLNKRTMESKGRKARSTMQFTLIG